jgi:hypothetical protein
MCFLLIFVAWKVAVAVPGSMESSCGSTNILDAVAFISLEIMIVQAFKKS